MEKLLHEYEENVAIKSKLANVIWKGGIIFFSVLYFVFNWSKLKSYSVFLYIAILVALFFISEHIFLKSAIRKIKSDTKIQLKNWKKIYNEINEYQKRGLWIFAKRIKLMIWIN